LFRKGQELPSGAIEAKIRAKPFVSVHVRYYQASSEYTEAIRNYAGGCKARS